MASYIDPSMRSRFESLSIDLKNAILEKNVQIKNLQDLIQCLQSIVDDT
ncbi:MAG: H-NS histone [Thermocaproicibacter melissae]|nr:molecular chaperone GroEL [Thermocaproicibacter melissae]WBY63435.1 molecular chaperone GroEL [Thermocaproicibacter melissae]